MSLFQRKQSIKDDRIDNFGRWPIRLTDFFLVDEYEFPPSPYSELFLVREGHFLHETDSGVQAVRAGTAMVHHPSARHVIKQPEQVRITRVRFLPEWFAGEYADIMGAPDVLGLFFARHWFEIPEDTDLQVFTTRESRTRFLSAALDLLEECLREERHAESISRVTLLEIMMLIGDDYHVYWRGGNRLPLPDTVITTMDIIERAVAGGGRLPLKPLQSATGMEQDELSQTLRKHIGLTLVDYLQRRRLHHAARQLIASDQSPAEIAENQACSDPETFEKEFEKLFHFTPEVYREKFRASETPHPATESRIVETSS